MLEPKTTNNEWTATDVATEETLPGTPSQRQTGIARETMEPTIEPGDPDVRRRVVGKTTSMRNSGDAESTTNAPMPNTAATPLFSDTDIGDLRSRWSNLQAEFVDEPRRAVEAADELVETVMQRLAEGFAKERSSLEEKWDRGETASTEDLRMALQRYRAFFNRLLNAA
jgi:hypothetical protein